MCHHDNWRLKAQFEGQIAPSAPSAPREPDDREEPQSGTICTRQPAVLLPGCKDCGPLPGNGKWASGPQIHGRATECNHRNWILRGEKWAHRNSEWLSRQVRGRAPAGESFFFFNVLLLCKGNCKDENAATHTVCPRVPEFRGQSGQSLSLSPPSLEESLDRVCPRVPRV